MSGIIFVYRVFIILMGHLNILINESGGQCVLLASKPMLFEKVPLPLKFGLSWIYWYGEVPK